MSVSMSARCNTEYFDEQADEPYLIVTLNGGASGTSIRRSWKEDNKASTGELKAGSINLQIFMEIRDIQGKIPINSGKILDIDARNLGGDLSHDMGRIIKEMGRSMEKIELLVKADKERWHDRWYGLLKKGTGEESNQTSGLLVMREKFIPRPRDLPESTISGLDVANLEPMTGAKSGSFNRMDQPKVPWHGKGGTGINPDRPAINYQKYSKPQGAHDRERSLSRSQERLKKDDAKTDLGGLRKLMESKDEE